MSKKAGFFTPSFCARKGYENMLLLHAGRIKRPAFLQAFGDGVTVAGLNYKYPTFWAKEIIELP
jgi:hypothetical protein